MIRVRLSTPALRKAEQMSLFGPLDVKVEAHTREVGGKPVRVKMHVRRGSIHEQTYRDRPGHLVRHGRSRVFVEGQRAAAEHMLQHLRSGGFPDSGAFRAAAETGLGQRAAASRRAQVGKFKAVADEAMRAYHVHVAGRTHEELSGSEHKRAVDLIEDARLAMARAGNVSYELGDVATHDALHAEKDRLRATMIEHAKRTQQKTAPALARVKVRG